MAPSQVSCELCPFCGMNFICPRFRMRSNLIFEERGLLGCIITHKVTVTSVKNLNTVDINFFVMLGSFESNLQDGNNYLIWKLF